tara:strand:+ start:4545 stop:4904 length:360 start_codon:yes stop_codon:yes gene_type:complete
MKINWEKSSRTVTLADMKVIDKDDIVPRTSTGSFRANTATVRLKNVQNKSPWVTIHIRGKSSLRTYSWNNETYEHASTCRVHFGNNWDGYELSGQLCGSLNFGVVDEVVRKVKKVMETK